MPDSKITALASIGTGTDPANDPLVIVDVSDVSPGGMSATGTTKKVTLNNLLACSPTATLASATITGDLTVKTNVLKVDTTNNRVGIGTASPNNTLTVRGSQDAGIEVNSADSNASRIITAYDPANTRFYINSTSSGSGTVLPLDFLIGNAAQYRIAASGVFTWYDGAGGTRMTLNSTGLGVGEAPASSQKLTVNGNGSIRNGNKLYLWDTGNSTAHGIHNSGDNLTFSKNNGTTSMTLDASGRLFMGTTAIGPWNTRLTLSTDSGTTKWSVGPWSSGGDTNFAVAATNTAGGVFLSGTAATSWTAISDERLKDIIEPITNAVTKIGSLRTVIGKFKNDENNTRKAFLIAQDVQAVLPEAVDASNPDRLGLAYTEVIPLLVAAIKELTARVQTLETR